ncbi:MAG: hypothetical protein L7H03_06445, partial [Vulcanisaeta sp.]|nr:hypothetical protein [Vulcanisaeta sp.]
MINQPPEEAPTLVRDFLSRSVGVVSLPLLTSVRRRAVRVGVWWSLDPLRRGLLEAAIAYLRGGFRFRSPKAMAMVRDALIEALTLLLMRSVRFLAFILGLRLAEKLGRALNRVFRVWEIIAMGIQWLNTP